MNKYEEPGQRLVSHGWSEEYRENHEKIFKGETILVKISYLSGDVINKVFLTKDDFELYLKQYDYDIVNWIVL